MEQYFEEFIQIMISQLIRGSHMDSCVGTRKTNTLVRGRFTSYMIVGGLGDFSFQVNIRGRFTWENLVDVRSGQQSSSRPTNSTTLMQTSTISEQTWGSRLLDCITVLLRMQGTEYICAYIHELLDFMHVLVISSEYKVVWVIDMSLEGIIRVHKQHRFITSDWGRLPFFSIGDRVWRQIFILHLDSYSLHYSQ